MRRGMTAVELALVLFTIAALVLLALPMLQRPRQGHRASCQNNLKQLGLACKMYANESKGERYPPLSPLRDNWMMSTDAVYPEYLPDLGVLVCPDSSFQDDAFTRNDKPDGTRHPECVTHSSYVYTGYALPDDYEAVAFFDTVRAGAWPGQTHVDITVTLPYGIDRLGLPGGGMYLLWDRIPNEPRHFAHRPPGGNVLFLDGHVEWRAYRHTNPPHDFPITRVSAQTFGSAWPQLPPECARYADIPMSENGEG